MMGLDRDGHEALLNELLDSELETSRRTEILQELRVDYSTASQSIEDFTSKTAKLQSDRDDLVVSNSKLFRQLGVVGDDVKEEEVEKKEYSETVTLEEIEGGY